MPVLQIHAILLVSLLMTSGVKRHDAFSPGSVSPPVQSSALPVCNCTITQSGNTYPVSALSGSTTAPAFYSYGTPNASSANTAIIGNNSNQKNTDHTRIDVFVEKQDQRIAKFETCISAGSIWCTITVKCRCCCGATQC